MELMPFERVSNVPYDINSEQESNIIDIENTFDFIDLHNKFNFEFIRADKFGDYRGVSCYKYKSLLYVGFDENYVINSVEFRLPFNIPNVEGLFYEGINLFQSTLLDVQKLFEHKGVELSAIDVGLEASSIGVSFFSDKYEDDLNVKLDAVTIRLRQSS